MPIFRNTEDDAGRLTEEDRRRIIEQGLTPLQIFQLAWNEFIPTDLITYVEAVNAAVDLNDAPDPWASAIYNVVERIDMELGSNPWVQERGYFLIGLLTRSGGGPMVLDQQVAAVRQVFHGFAYSGLRIHQVDGPHDTDPESIGEWWLVSLTAQFTFDVRRSAAPGPLPLGWQGVPPGFPITPPPANGARFAP